MDGRRRRGGSPDLSYDDPEGIVRSRSVILETIHGCYKEALDALPLEDMPELAPRLLAAGVCFGFADPITNIISNALCFLPNDKDGGETEPEPEPDAAEKHKRRKMMTKASPAIVSEIVAAGNLPSPPEARTIAERSLEGLITFLTCYFRYLRTWDALRYLCRAKADLLVAVRLIEFDRCYRNKEEDEFHIRGQDCYQMRSTVGKTA
ncbi:hypothetical protein E2562_012694 [Oryza meyeriana var. granulata]|uniref:PIR2-like helical domain-containing protein n=1 Tax=Oryza meyeriana var. granulata TaxID=110450 RepID=A0A6G1CHC7_9ORYZ|nr:hypothetical protein E2562_012694 [Oryza meyeriana var. granulata]